MAVENDFKLTMHSQIFDYVSEALYNQPLDHLGSGSFKKRDGIYMRNKICSYGNA